MATRRFYSRPTTSTIGNYNFTQPPAQPQPTYTYQPINTSPQPQQYYDPSKSVSPAPSSPAPAPATQQQALQNAIGSPSINQPVVNPAKIPPLPQTNPAAPPQTQPNQVAQTSQGTVTAAPPPGAPPPEPPPAPLENPYMKLIDMLPGSNADAIKDLYAGLGYHGVEDDINKLYDDLLKQHEGTWDTTQKNLETAASAGRRTAMAANAEAGRSLGGSFLGGLRQSDIASMDALNRAQEAFNQQGLDISTARAKDLIGEKRAGAKSQYDTDLAKTADLLHDLGKIDDRTWDALKGAAGFSGDVAMKDIDTKNALDLAAATASQSNLESNYGKDVVFDPVNGVYKITGYKEPVPQDVVNVLPEEGSAGFEEDMKALKDFYDKNGRWPTKAEATKIESDRKGSETTAAVTQGRIDDYNKQLKAMVTAAQGQTGGYVNIDSIKKALDKKFEDQYGSGWRG